jgi:glycosyltransferase involved in cell wall biosynthesis
VSTNVDGIPEAVEDGVSGILVPPSDPAALAAGIVKILESPDLRASMGAAGKARVQERFTLDRMVEGLGDVYREVARR